MIPEVVSVQSMDGHRLRLTFHDGATGDVDVAALVEFHGVFEPLRDLSEFRKVRVDADSGTVAWPNGADLDPVVLYSTATGLGIQDVLADSSRKKH